MVECAARLHAGERLHLWLRPLPGTAVAHLTITVADRTHALTVAGPSRNPLPVVWDNPTSGDARFAWDDEAADVSVIYGFDPAGVPEAGIRVIWASAAARIDGARYQFHFHPPFGWMNDPNGLCEVDGVTHLFYQHNPHDRRWDTMHWGHAVSRDGLAWVDQPIALLPEETLVRGPTRQGGAFSGSALPRPDGTVRLFYTDRDDGRAPARERQATTLLNASGSAGPATLLLKTHPPVPGYRNDWRDPFVFEGPDGRLKVLLGGADAGGSVVLLYETDDLAGTAGWRFVDVLFREASRRHIPAECPCMIRLDGEDLWVLIFGLIGSRDEPTRRRNLTRAHVGQFDGRRFVALAEHELDFGTDCYAMQVWRGADGPRGIAWAANWTDISADCDFETAMTLPRRLLWRNGRLFTPPIPAIESLRKAAPAKITPGIWLALRDGLAEIMLDFEPGQPFHLEFEHPTHDLMLTYDGETLELHYDPPGNRTVPSYRTTCSDLQTVRIFVDVGLIEIYADEGRACCTKRIDSAAHVDAVRISTDTPISATVWPLRPQQVS